MSAPHSPGARLRSRASASGALTSVAALALSLTLTRGSGARTSPSGTQQRSACPWGTAARMRRSFATREAHRRHVPGRIIGVSGTPPAAPRSRMRCRRARQHIRREKATSNICTAQVLLAGDGEHVRRVSRAGRAAPHRRAGAYARRPASRRPSPGWAIGSYAHVVLRHAVRRGGVVGAAAPARRGAGAPHQSAGHLSHTNRHLARTRPRRSATSPTSSRRSRAQRSAALHGRRPRRQSRPSIPESLHRTSSYLTHPVFHRYRSETEMAALHQGLEARDCRSRRR